MAEYKNWYLAGGSGMKDERKKLKLIILQCIAVITVNFITIWYFEELFFRGFWYVIFASFILTFIYIIRTFFIYLYFVFFTYKTVYLLPLLQKDKNEWFQ